MSYENFGRYELIKKLATGGMAQIYLARQKGLEGFEKLLVIKRILPHLSENEDFIKMFFDEARIAARLNHANVVQIFDLDKEGDTAFIAMEYIHGEDVRRVWKKAESQGRTVPIPLVLRIVMEACAGLDYAHKKTDQNGRPLGIVHRDISPQNILVTFEGGVKVVDFGIAKAADQATVTRSGVLKGKYSYMSPEQAAGKQVDSRTDIFALGVVLFELLTGRRLFKRANDIQTLNAVAQCEVPPPSAYTPSIPPDLDAIVLKTLAKNPEDRFPEARQLQLALEEWLITHQFASSSAHLANFLQEIYADRLDEERQTGEPLPEPLTSEVERSPDEEKPRGKSGGQGSQSRPKTPSGPPRQSREDSTTAARPRNTQGGAPRESGGAAPTMEVRREPRKYEAETDPRTHTVDRAQDPKITRQSRALSPAAFRAEVEAPDRTSTPRDTAEAGRERQRPPKQRRPSRPEAAAAPKSKKMLWLVGGAAVAALAVLGVLNFGPTPPSDPTTSRFAKVTVVTEPEGATLTIDGKAVAGVTPIEVSQVSPGMHQLALTLDGYHSTVQRFDFPASGEALAGPYRLVSKEQVATVEDDPPEVAQVRLRLRSDPPGAKLFVNGENRGAGSLELSGTPGATFSIRAELAGHRNWEREITLSDAEEQEVVADLERIKRVENTNNNTVSAGARGTGQLRVFVEPWGRVTCSGKYLGETPLADKTLPVGSYDCTISNDDFPAVKRKVEIRANELSKLIVRFADSGGGGGGP